MDPKLRIFSLLLLAILSHGFSVQAQTRDPKLPRTLGQRSGVWISRADLKRLSTRRSDWSTVVSFAQSKLGEPQISDQNSNHDVQVLAKAYVGVRLADSKMLGQARSEIIRAIGTEEGGRSLAAGRNLVPYIVAADLVGLDARQETLFREWLRQMLSKDLSGRSLRSTHEDRPNNWGSHAGAARAAIASYLQDREELERTARVLHGYLGNRDAYSGFRYGELSWQANAKSPVGINPLGSIKDGVLIDGVQPDDMRRGGTFRWPPGHTQYPWEALQGLVVQAEVLYRQGFDTWDWEDQAILRAVRFLYSIDFPPRGDDTWLIYLVNARYGTRFPTDAVAAHGKNMGWTSWTHRLGRRPLYRR